MRAVRTDRKLELEQQFVRARTVCIVRTPVLASHLAELARPVGQRGGCAFIDQRRVERTARPVIPNPGKPPSRELVVAGHVVPHCILASPKLLALAPYNLAAPDERVVD